MSPRPSAYLVIRMKKLICAALLAAFLLSLCGCAANPASPAASGSPAVSESPEAGTLQVTATFTPVTLVAQAVIGEVPGVTLSTMAPAQAGCLHDYQLTMADRKLLECSDLLLACGGGMESFLDDVRDAHPALAVCEASAGYALLPSDTREFNAHLWMSADGAAHMAGTIAEALEEADPAHGADYRRNAETFSKAALALRDEYRERLSGVSNPKIVIFHESFSYTAQDLGLEVVGIIAKEPDEEPSAKELNEVIAAVRQNGVTALFADAQYDDRAAQTVAAETGAGCYTVNSLTGEAEGDYLTVMRENYETVAGAVE